LWKLVNVLIMMYSPWDCSNSWCTTSWRFWNIVYCCLISMSGDGSRRRSFTFFPTHVTLLCRWMFSSPPLYVFFSAVVCFLFRCVLPLRRFMFSVFGQFCYPVPQPLLPIVCLILTSSQSVTRKQERRLIVLVGRRCSRFALAQVRSSNSVPLYLRNCSTVASGDLLWSQSCACTLFLNL